MNSREEFEKWATANTIIRNFTRREDGGYYAATLDYRWVSWKASRQALDDEHEPLYIVLANEESGHEWVFVDIETEDGRSVSAGEREPHSCGVRVGPFYTRPARADDEQE